MSSHRSSAASTPRANGPSRVSSSRRLDSSRLALLLCRTAVWPLFMVPSARASAQLAPEWYAAGDIGIGKLVSETGFAISLGSAGVWSRLMGAARVDFVFVPSSHPSRCFSAARKLTDWNSLCDPRRARLGVMFEVDLVVPTESNPFFVGVGYRAGGGRSTALGSGGFFFHTFDRPVNPYVRLTGGLNYIELSIGALLSHVR